MKKLTYLKFFLILFSTYAFGQNINFELADPQPTLIDVYGGSIASADIDGDGDQDLMISGLDPGRETALYLNDGDGNFSEITNTPFPEASETVTIFEDLDLDGDLDLYFSGMGFSIEEFSHIYLNDGFGEFSQISNPELPNFRGTGAAIGDLDNDGDYDIIISASD